MIWFWIWMSFALGNPCPGTLDETVSNLIERGDVPAYRCMVALPSAVSELSDKIRTGTPQTKPRLQRALVFALMQEVESPWEPEVVQLLSPADRRILADAVKARRGRKSPSELHHHIFEQWDWYQPKPGYTDNLLTSVDRTNISMADDPTALLKAEPVNLSPAAPVDVSLQPVSAPSSGCSCSTAPVFQFEVGLLVLLFSLGVCRLRWS